MIYSPNCESYLLNYGLAIKDNTNIFSKLQLRQEAYPTLDDVIENTSIYESSRIFFQKNYSKNYTSKSTAEEEFCILTTLAQSKNPYLEIYGIYLQQQKELDEFEKNKYIPIINNINTKKIDVVLIASKNVLSELEKKIGNFLYKNITWPTNNIIQIAAENILQEKYPRLKNSAIVIK